MASLGAQRQRRWLLLFGMCLLLLSSIPARQALADVTITQPIDNTVNDFTRGSFQRTSLGLLQGTQQQSPKLADQPGAVQLGAVGILNNWTNYTTSLPRALYHMGTTALGTRIFVIGGQASAAGGSETIADVYSAQVSVTNGQIPEGWRAEPSLIPAVGSTQITTPISATDSAAVTSYSMGGNSGYIYVIGGNVSQGRNSVSSFAVRVATVDGNGAITGWRELSNAQIPDAEGKVGSDTFNQLGLASASAVTYTIGGKTFIYLFGGVQRYLEGAGGQANTASLGSRSVFYAQINTGNGGLYKPSNPSQEGWDVLPDIPIDREFSGTVRDDAGLWDSAAVTGHFDLKPDGAADTDTIYLLGGQVAPNKDISAPAVFTSRVYQAFVLSDGKLIWSDWSGTMPEARIGHQGVLYHGNLYVTGGIPAQSGNQPDNNMLASYVQDDLTLPSLGTNNFYKSDVLPVRRTFHSMVLVQAGSGANSVAYLYMLGGRGDTQDANPGDDNGTADVVFSRIGGDDTKEYAYPPDGWFYSKTYPINFANAEIQEISWAALITRTTGLNPDIALDYRISTANTCDNPGFSDNEGDPTGWRPLDGTSPDDAIRSVNGQNSFEIGELPARCFQYRAKLTSGSATVGAKETPSLLNLGIKIILPGSPDLKVARANVIPGKIHPEAFGGLDIAITNKNDAEETQPASAEGGGSFFVDLLVYEPGETPNLSPALPLSGADEAHSKAYANVSKDLLTPNATVSIQNWCDSAVNGCQPYDITKVITKVGTYTFVVVVDSTGGPAPYVLVRETSPGGENNNIQTVTYNAPANTANPGQPLPPEPQPLPDDRLRILLPLIGK